MADRRIDILVQVIDKASKDLDKIAAQVERLKHQGGAAEAAHIETEAIQKEHRARLYNEESHLKLLEQIRLRSEARSAGQLLVVRKKAQEKAAAEAKKGAQQEVDDLYKVYDGLYKKIADSRSKIKLATTRETDPKVIAELTKEYDRLGGQLKDLQRVYVGLEKELGKGTFDFKELKRAAEDYGRELNEQHVASMSRVADIRKAARQAAEETERAERRAATAADRELQRIERLYDSQRKRISKRLDEAKAIEAISPEHAAEQSRIIGDLEQEMKRLDDAHEELAAKAKETGVEVKSLGNDFDTLSDSVERNTRASQDHARSLRGSIGDIKRTEKALEDLDEIDERMTRRSRGGSSSGGGGFFNGLATMLAGFLGGSSVRRDTDRLRESITDVREEIEDVGHASEGTTRKIARMRGEVRRVEDETEGWAGVLKQTQNRLGELRDRLENTEGPLRRFGNFNQIATFFIAVLASAAIELGGALIAVAGAALTAGAAIGGALVAGLAAAIPIVGLLIGGFIQLAKVIGISSRQRANSLSQAARLAQGGGTGGGGTADTGPSAEDMARRQRDALERVADAQRRLTEARRDAIRTLQDLADKEREAVLATLQSDLGVRQAKIRLQQAIQSGTASDVRDAQLSLEAAQISRSQQARDTQRTVEDAAKTRQQGVEGNPQVVEATRALRDARESLADVNKNVASSAAAAAAASEGLALADYRLEEQIKRLTPEQRKLLKAFNELRDEFNSPIWRRVGDAVLRPFTIAVKGITELLRDPAIQKSVQALADALGGTLGKATKDLLGSARGTGFLTFVLDAARELIPLLDRIARPLVSLVDKIVRGAMPTLRFILGGLGDEVDGLDRKLSQSKITKFFKDAEPSLTAFGRVFRELIRLIANLTGSSTGAGVKIIESFAGWLKDLNDNFDSSGAKDWFDSVVPGIEALAKGLADVGAAIFEGAGNGGLESLGHLLSEVVAPALQNVLSVSRLLFELMDKYLGNKIGAWILSVIFLQKAFGVVALPAKFLLSFGSFIRFLGVASAGGPLAARGITAVGLALRGLMVASVIGAIIAAVVTAIIILEKKWHVFSRLWEWLQKVAPPILEEVKKKAGEFFESLSQWADETLRDLQPVFDWIGKNIPPILQDIWDVAQDVFEWLAKNVPPILAQMLEDAQTVFGWLRDYVPPAVEAVVDAIEGVISFVRKHWRGIVQLIAGPMGLVVKIVMDNWDLISGAIGSALEGIWEVISGVLGDIATLFEGVFSGEDSIVSDVKDAFNEIKDFLTKNQISQWIAESVNGIIPAVSGAFSSLVRYTVWGLNKVIDAINWFGNLIEYLGLNWNDIQQIPDPTASGPAAQNAGGDARPGGDNAIGGWIPATNGGRRIRVSEGGYDELVLTTDPRHQSRNELLLHQYQQRTGTVTRDRELVETPDTSIEGREDGRRQSVSRGGPTSGRGGAMARRLVAALRAAQFLDQQNIPYSYGGGHSSSPVDWHGSTGIISPSGRNYGNTVGLDCSSSVSWVMQQVYPGFPTMTSGDMMSWGEAGRGLITLWPTKGHVFMDIGSLRYGTGGLGENGGFGRDPGRSDAGISPRHPPDMPAGSGGGGGLIDRILGAGEAALGKITEAIDVAEDIANGGRKFLDKIGDTGPVHFVADIAKGYANMVKDGAIKWLHDHVPGFETGGTVPGAPGQESLIRAHGGEQVLTRGAYKTAKDLIADLFGNRRPGRTPFVFETLAEELKRTDQLLARKFATGSEKAFSKFLNAIEILTNKFSALVDNTAKRLQDKLKKLADRFIIGAGSQNPLSATGDAFTGDGTGDSLAVDAAQGAGSALDEQQATLTDAQKKNRGRRARIEAELKRLRGLRARLVKKRNRRGISAAAKKALTTQIERIDKTISALVKQKDVLKGQSNEITGALEENQAAQIENESNLIDATASQGETQLGLAERRGRLAELMGDSAGVTAALRERGSVLDRRLSDLIDLRSRYAEGSAERNKLEGAILDLQIAIKENTNAIEENTGKKEQNFSSSAWQLFRRAIFDGNGGLLPQLQVPGMATGGYVLSEGLVRLHPGEVYKAADVRQGKVGGDTSIQININEAQQTADPVYMAKRLAFELATRPGY